MTIKQQGGIFGRNPTFNDVTVDGTLTSNSISLTSLDDVPIGSSTPSTGAFTILDANSGTFGQQSTGSGLLSGVSDEFSVGLNQDNGNTSNTQIWNAFTNGASSATYQVRYRSANDTGTAAVRFQVNGPTGDATINNGNLIIGTSGKGIDFSATSGTGTSELFDDYEEGTWTPTWEGNTTPGTITASTLVATYTKVGRIVHVQVYAIFNVAVAGSGYLKVTLPFSKASNTMFCGPLNTYNIDLPAGAVDSTVVPTSSVPSNNIALFSVSTDNGATGLIDASGINTSDEILFAFSYIAA